MIDFLFQYWLVAGFTRVIFWILKYGYKGEEVSHRILFFAFLIGFYTLPLDFIYTLGKLAKELKEAK